MGEGVFRPRSPAGKSRGFTTAQSAPLAYLSFALDRPPVQSAVRPHRKRRSLGSLCLLCFANRWCPMVHAVLVETPTDFERTLGAHDFLQCSLATPPPAVEP